MNGMQPICQNSPPVSFISFISDFLDGIDAPQSGDLKIASPENVSVGDDPPVN